MFSPLFFRVAPAAAASRRVRHRMATPLGALVILLLVQATSLGQVGTTLAGRVLDGADGAAVGFASVVVEQVESGEMLTGTLTGEDGRFLVQGLAPGEYKIWTSFPGFVTAEADFLVGELNQTYDLGDIHLVRLESFEPGFPIWLWYRIARTSRRALISGAPT